MHIEKKPSGDLLEIVVEGALDNNSSIHFRNEIDSSIHEGWHRIVVDLKGVSYLSSAGIAALVALKKQLDRLTGLFGVFNLTPPVETVLKQMRLLNVLVCDPQAVRLAHSAGPMTIALSSETRFVSEEGIDMEIYPLGDSKPMICRMIGDAQALGKSAANPALSHRVAFDRGSLGIGLGALGADSDPSESRIGEILAVEGAAAQSPQVSGGLPDYSVAVEDFTPLAQMMYGVQCSGDLPTLIRFEPAEPGDQIGLSKLIGQAMRQTETEAAAFVILADCGGLVGAQLRQTAGFAAARSKDRFQVPTIRQWLSFSSDRLYRRNLALIVGVAAASDLENRSPLRPFVRRMCPGRDLFGHFHSAVFGYQPLKKRTLQLQASIAELFDQGAIEDVLHLLHDDRPITGAGESELRTGACWMGVIGDVVAAEEQA